ncbi:54S ribosomal protein L39, mitochondrial [Basidiobolus ranarum]|uniref:Large ribosomal subunit protein bL33m n=1 Tax=Basidiobolus ranarum TaxID=34480 RepID=A0ABR2VP92_9FUNG
MAKAKTRTVIVKLVSTAGTGFFYTRTRPRINPKLAFRKYDPKVRQHVLFTEQKVRG